MEEHRLDFLNPQYHRGSNVTIRKGDRWYTKARVGDKITIYQTGDNTPLASGTIVDINLIWYKDVKIRHLLDEHDVECRTPFGLTYAMLRAYPDFTLEDEVTVIRFNIE